MLNRHSIVNSLCLKFSFVKSQKYFFHLWFGVIPIYFLPKQLLWGGGDEVIIGDGRREGFRRYLIPNFSSDIMETASFKIEI